MKWHIDKPETELTYCGKRAEDFVVTAPPSEVDGMREAGVDFCRTCLKRYEGEKATIQKQETLIDAALEMRERKLELVPNEPTAIEAEPSAELYAEHIRALRNFRDFGPLACQFTEGGIIDGLLEARYIRIWHPLGYGITDKGLLEVGAE